MRVCVALTITGVVMAGTTAADPLSPDAARHFIAGKMFAFNCFEGTRGAGYIQDDGSVEGYIQVRGAGQERFVTLPAISPVRSASVASISCALPASRSAASVARARTCCETASASLRSVSVIERPPSARTRRCW